MAENKYQVNENLLQSYRQVFLSFESLLLAVGAIVFDKHPGAMLVITAIGVSTIWAIWHRIVRSRHLIVDYYKFEMKNYMQAENNSEDAYVHDHKERKTANKNFEADNPGKLIRNGYRPTRAKLDLALPILLTVVWGVLLTLSFYNCLVSPSCFLHVHAWFRLLLSLLP